MIIYGILFKMKNKILSTCLQRNHGNSQREFSNTSHGMLNDQANLQYAPYLYNIEIIINPYKVCEPDPDG